MGANASRGTDNQSLVDKLLDSRHPLPEDVERALRLVDRGDYFEEASSRAYVDLAWRSGNIHLSAPSIYVSVLRHLDLAPGQHFLNVGSGSGYFSTIAGLLIGYNGINHGIELIEENVQFARKRLQSFLANSDAPFERDFCAPQFVHGNIFHLLCPPGEDDAYTGPTSSDGTQSDSEPEDINALIQPEHNRAVVHLGLASSTSNDCQSEEDSDEYPGYSVQISIDPPPHINLVDKSMSEPWPLYDRMYVGAAVRNKTHLKSILRLLKVGGILIAPVQDELVKIIRLSTDRIHRIDLMSVSFAPLIIPPRGSPTVKFPAPAREVPSLLRLCGRVIRTALRRRIEQRKGGLPVLGRMQQIDEDVERKKRRQTQPTTDDLDLTTSSDPSSSCQTAESDSESTDTQTEDQEDGRVSSSPSPDDNPDRNNASRNSIRVAQLLRCFLRHSGLNHGLVENDDEDAAGNRVQHAEDDTGAENAHPSSSSCTRQPVPNSTENDASQSTIPTSSHDTDSLNTNGDRHRRTKKRRLKYQPPSYLYREEMRTILSDDLNLPEFFIRDVLLI